MSDFDNRLRAMAGAEVCPVPEGFESRIEKQLEELSGTKARKLRPARWALLAACLCLVLAGTVAATGKLDFNMWATYEQSFSACESAFRTQGYILDIPEQIGEYTFEYLQKLYVVPAGTQFLAAISGSAVYRPMDITYRCYDDAHGTTRDLSVCIGKTDREYWSTYFSYDPVTLEFSADPEWHEANELTKIEYRGHTVYLYSKKGMDQTQAPQYAIWLDQNLGLCFSVSLCLSELPENINPTDISVIPSDYFPGDIVPYVEWIIDHFS